MRLPAILVLTLPLLFGPAFADCKAEHRAYMAAIDAATKSMLDWRLAKTSPEECRRIHRAIFSFVLQQR
jgi:hypothetical protein